MAGNKSRVYVIHPITFGYGDFRFVVQNNRERLQEVLDTWRKQFPDYEFVTPAIDIPISTSEEEALKICKDVLKECDEAWVVLYVTQGISILSRGMVAEIVYALSSDIPVKIGQVHLP